MISNFSKIGKVFIVGAGPGDPELITLKAVRLLGEANVVFYDRLTNPDFLKYAPASARMINVGKQAGRPCISQNDINKMLAGEAMKGKNVVRLKGGDPFIFGRGGEECLELSRLGIPFEVVPGISSISAVPAYAGIPLTMRNLATGFTVISGHLHPDSDAYDWSALSATSTLVILMGLRNLPVIIGKLRDRGRSAETPIAIIRWGTTKEQQVVTGTLTDILEKSINITSPVTIVVGDVVKYHETLSWFHPENNTEATREYLSAKSPEEAAAAL